MTSEDAPLTYHPTWTQALTYANNVAKRTGLRQRVQRTRPGQWECMAVWLEWI